MKTKILLLCALLLNVSCSSREKATKDWVENGATCNQICKENKEVGEISFKAGGGMPLLFLGGVEVKCACRGTK